MTRRRLIAALAAALVGLPIAALLGAAVVLVLFDVAIDMARWRDAITTRATASLGRPVALDGALELVLGRETRLRVGGVRILNPPGFAATEFAALGDARARVDLFAALRGELHVLSFEAADGRVRLERAADGRTNWAAREGATAARTEPALPQPAIEIDRIALNRLTVEYVDARSDTRHVLALDEVLANGRWDEPLKLQVRGRVDETFRYTVEVAGGSARLLQEASAPWPFALDFEFLGTRLHADGTVDAGKREARFDFGAGTEDLAQVERFLQTKLPKFGVAALTGKVLASAAAVELKALRGVLGDSELHGGLALTLGGARQRMTGALTVATLDLRPFLDGDTQKRDEPLSFDELARHTLPLRDLVPFDVDLDLRVGRWLGLPGDIRDARLELRADARGVRTPIGATFAGVPLTGRLDLDTAAATPTFALELGARGSALGDLARVLTGATGIDGTLGRFDLRLGGRGETLGALVRDLELAVAVAASRLSYGNIAGGRSVAFTLDALDVAVRRGERLRGTARGTLLGERAALAIRGGKLPDMLRELAAPVEIDLTAANAKVRIEGTLARPEATRGTDLAFRVDARRSGDLARWLGVAPESNLPLALRGRARVESDEWHLDETTLKLGHSDLTIDAHRTGIGGKPVIVAAVRSTLLDVPELETLRARQSTPADAKIDVPILPYGIDLEDADLGLGLQRVVLGRAELADVGFGARIREGRLAPSPFAAIFAGVPFEGLFGLDLRSDVPEVSLAMSTGRTDVGALLRRLGVAEDIDGHADALQVEITGRGSRLRDMAERSTFEARLLGGEIAVRGASTEPLARIRLKEAVIAAPPGKRIAARLDGALDETPVEILVWSGTLADFARDASKVPFSVDAKAAGARLTLEGEVALPLGRGGQLTLEMRGERLDALSGLARVELPPWGPWSIRGPFQMTPTGYEVRRLQVRVGTSRLNGTGRFDVTGARPRLDVRITAPNVQLDDFPYPAARAGAPPSGTTPEDLRATARGAATQTQALLSAAFLRRLDAFVDVEVRQVLSGTDRLGDGRLVAQIVEGRLYLGPIDVNLPGGTAKLSILYDPTKGAIELAAGAYVERFDYGILARRLRRADDVKGLFSLNLELSGTAPSLDTIMSHASGKVDFAVWPTDVRAGVFDLWSVNVFLALLPFIDPRAESRVNCVVGRFDLNDGKLRDDTLVIDTTRVRVRGAGGANFETEALGFRFRPRAKGLALLSLQTPLQVTGTFTDYSVGVEAGDVLATILRLLGSVIVVPFEWLTQGPLPRDGADVCTDPLRQTGAAKR